MRADLLSTIDAAQGCSLTEREPYFFSRWVGDEWGRVGSRVLAEELGGADAYLSSCGGYDRAQLDFGERVRASLS